MAVRQLVGKTLTLEADPETTVGDLRAAVQARAGIPNAQLRLQNAARTLQDTQTLAESGVANESTLYLGGLIRGGGGKKKRKIMPKVQPLEKTRLPTTFLCLFCDHKTCWCKMCGRLPRLPSH